MNVRRGGLKLRDLGIHSSKRQDRIDRSNSRLFQFPDTQGATDEGKMRLMSEMCGDLSADFSAGAV